MRLPCPVTHGADTVMQMMIPNMHDYFAIMISPVGLTIESMGMPVRWGPGIAAEKSALASDVRHAGHPIALEQHDLGPMLWHLTLVPTPDPLNVTKHLLQSECRFIFSNGEVQIQGQPAACTGLVSAPMPMMACGFPADTPIMTAITNVGNSVIMGVHLVDVLAGWAAITVQMLLESYSFAKDVLAMLTLSRGVQAKQTFFQRRKTLRSIRRLSEVFGGRGFGDDYQGSNSWVIGGVRLAGRLLSDYQGPGVRVTRGNTELEVVANPDGSGRVTVERRVGGAGLVQLQGARDSAGHRHVGLRGEAGGYGLRGQVTDDPSASGPALGDTDWRLEGAGTSDAWTGGSEDWDLSRLPEDISDDDWLGQ